MNLIRVVGLIGMYIGLTLSIGHAAAQSLTPDDLSAALLTPDDVSATFLTIGSGDQLTTAGRVNILDHSTLFPNAVLVERSFKTPDGVVLSSLISSSDSPPTSDSLGAFLMRFSHLRFDLVPETPEEGLQILGPSGIGDTDLSATFPANWEGKPIQIYADAFVKNSVYGVLFYGSPDYDGTTTASALAQAQTSKLP